MAEPLVSHEPQESGIALALAFPWRTPGVLRAVAETAAHQAEDRDDLEGPVRRKTHHFGAGCGVDAGGRILCPIFQTIFH